MTWTKSIINCDELIHFATAGKNEINQSTSCAMLHLSEEHRKKSDSLSPEVQNSHLMLLNCRILVVSNDPAFQVWWRMHQHIFKSASNFVV
jgi:hypothetical protein